MVIGINYPPAGSAMPPIDLREVAAPIPSFLTNSITHALQWPEVERPKAYYKNAAVMQTVASNLCAARRRKTHNATDSQFAQRLELLRAHSKESLRRFRQIAPSQEAAKQQLVTQTKFAFAEVLLIRGGL